MIPELLGARDLGDAFERLALAVEPRTIVVGWATVELDRAELEVPTAFPAMRSATPEAAPEERLLGARCRRLGFDSGRGVVLLEPSTEGRLAAALARHGEGPLVAYLIGDASSTERARRAGFTVTGEHPGPLGRERLVIVGRRDGPFAVVVVESDVASAAGD